jgi:AraC-like DNA-binding protein
MLLSGLREVCGKRKNRAQTEPCSMDSTRSRGLLAARYTRTLLDASRRSGVEVASLFGDEPVFATRGRSTAWGHDDLRLVSKNLQEALGDELWGMVPGHRVALGTFRFACELFTVSGVLEEAFGRAFRLYDLGGAVRFRLETNGDEASVAVILPPAGPRDAAFLHEWWLWLWHYVAQWFVRAEIGLSRVEFPHAPAPDAEVYGATFGSRCQFGAGAARIVFPRRELQRPVARSLAEVEELFSRTQVTLEYAPAVERRVSTSIKVALLRRLQRESALPTLEELAAEQGVTGQTLRRWLAAEGESYRGLKAEVRSLVARQHLSRPDATLSEVATRAGFAETSAFTRAFRAWTGMNVSAFRRRLDDAQSPAAQAPPPPERRAS